MSTHKELAGRLRDALSEAIEFAEQDHHVLTPAGEEMVQRWREAADLLDSLSPPEGVGLTPLQPRCQHCNDTGFVVIRAATGIYIRPGPVPDDARGMAEAPCWECLTYPGSFDGPTGAD